VTGYRNAFSRNWYKLNDVSGVSISAILADPEAHASEMAILRGGDSADGALRLRANNRSYLSSGIQAVAGVRFGPESLRHSLEAGVRLHADHEDRFQWDDRYRMEGGTLVRTSAGVPGSQTNQLGEARAAAFFVQDEIRAGRLAVVPGLRYEVVDFTRTRWAPTDADRIGETTVAENRVSVLIPGIGATWEWTPARTSSRACTGASAARARRGPRDAGGGGREHRGGSPRSGTFAWRQRHRVSLGLREHPGPGHAGHRRKRLR
jgi:Fe(3+) dicitrate transport protein